MDTPVNNRTWHPQRECLTNPGKFFSDLLVATAGHAAMAINLGDRVLDLGCGDGFFTYYIYSRRSDKIVAVDMDEDALAVAREHHANNCIKYVCADMMTLTIQPGEFDVVIMRGLLFEAATHPLFGELVQRIAAGLPPGGRFVGDMPCKQDAVDALRAAYAASGLGGSVQGLKMADGRVELFWNFKK